jgi:hypothetical protein
MKKQFFHPLEFTRADGVTVGHSATPIHISGYGGLVVSMLAPGTQDRGFTPGQSHRKKSSACLSSEGK